MVKYEELTFDKLKDYESIDMKFTTNKIYCLNKVDNGLGGILLEEKEVEKFSKDFGNKVSSWIKKIDKSNWKMFIAKDDNKIIGGCIIASKTANVNMLEGCNDLAVLWDIRVLEKYKNQGIGYNLFNLAKKWSKDNNFKQLKIECQTNNYNAVKFYHRQGSVLGAIKEHVYDNYPDEVQLLWYLDL